MPNVKRTPVERRRGRAEFVASLTAELVKLDSLIDRAKKYVRDTGLRDLTLKEVETMRARASKRSERFEREIVKPLDGDLKRRAHDKRRRL